MFRCFGDVDPVYYPYHDEEWGRELHGDNELFERLVLEGFQSGLSWLTILKRRPAFRAAFYDFDIDKVAAFDEQDVERLMSDAGIIRNRRKIEAAVQNAQAARALRESGKSLDGIIWGHAPAEHKRPTSWDDVPTETEESRLLAKALKSYGFVFVGPTTMYALMQAIGMVNDHLIECAFANL